jgi:hypothetical protein
MEYGKVRKREKERKTGNAWEKVPTGSGASLTELKGA